MTEATGQMQALRVLPGSRKETLETVPIPEIGPDDVLIQVKSAGLAPGVFNMIRMGMLSDLPATLGHETAGVVDKVGENVTRIKVGNRVRVHSSMGCSNCEYCLMDKDQMCPEAGIQGFARFAKKQAPFFEEYRHGGLAEFVRAPSWLVDELPDHVSFDVGAKVHELATALCTIKRAELKPGATVIVTAATGAVGSAVIKIAPFFGIQRLVLVGRSKQRLENVAKLTTIATDFVALNELSEQWEEKKELAGFLARLLPRGADAIIDLNPSGTGIWQVFAALKTGGCFVHLGANMAVLPLPMGVIMSNGWTIAGTRNHSRNDALTILNWLDDRRLEVDELITHKWPKDQIHEAVERLRDRSQPMWMSVVNF